LPQAVNNNALPTIDPTEEQVIITFDYSGQLNIGVTILGVLSVTCGVRASSPVADPSPQSRLIDNAVIIASPLNAQPLQAVTQLVGNMISGALYVIQCVVVTSDGQQPSLWIDAACLAPS
jgi:hypothetical protein